MSRRIMRLFREENGPLAWPWLSASVPGAKGERAAGTRAFPGARELCLQCDNSSIGKGSTMMRSFFVLLVTLGLGFGAGTLRAASAHGWLSWRGPDQNGTSREKNLPDKVAASQALWTAELPGQSTPVVANGRVYILGFVG